MYVRPTAPRTVGGVLDDGIRLYRSSFSRCWPLALCMHLLIALCTLWLLSGVLTASVRRNPAAVLAAFESPRVWTGYLLLMLVILVFHAALIRSIDAMTTGRPVGFGGALRRGLGLLPRMVGMSLLLILAVGGTGAVAALVAGLTSAAGLKPRLMPVILGVVTMILIVYMMGRLFLAPVALVMDDAGALRSLNLSWTLTRKRWWRAATIYTVAVIILVGVELVIALVRLLAQRFIGAGAAVLVIEQGINVLLGSLIASFHPAILVSMYGDLKLRWEGSDLAMRVDALAVR